MLGRAPIILFALTAQLFAASELQTAPQNSAPNTLPVILFDSWRDPMESAFTVSVPRGWQINGGASRRAAVDVRNVVRAVSPGGRVQIFVDDPDIVPRQVPDAMMMRAGYREGQTIKAAWGGPLRLERFRTGDEYAREYTNLKLCRTPDFTGGSEVPDQTAAINRQASAYASAAGVDARGSVGDAYFRCGSNYGYVIATTVLAQPRLGPGARTWAVLTLGGFVVQRAIDIPYASYVLHTMTSTLKIDPAWQARNDRDVQGLTAAVTRMQDAMMASLAQQSATLATRERSNVVSKMPTFDVMKGWEARNKAMDQTFEKDTEVRRGVTVTEDPIWGSRSVSNDYNYYWTRADGSIVGTRTDSPPTVDGGGWRLMTNH